MTDDKLNGYALTKSWFNHAYENPEAFSPVDHALYFWVIECANRNGWKPKFSFSARTAMEVLGIAHYNTYKKAFDKLVAYGFIMVVRKSPNHHQATIISIAKNEIVSDTLSITLTNELTNELTTTLSDTFIKQETINEKQEREKAHSPENFKRVAPNYTNNLTYGAYERLWDVPIPQAFKEKLNGRTDAEKILGAISEKWDTFCKVRYTAHNKRFHTDISEAQALSDFLRQCKSLDHAMQSLDAMIGKEAINPFVVEYKQQTVTAQSKRLVL